MSLEAHLALIKAELPEYLREKANRIVEQMCANSIRGETRAQGNAPHRDRLTEEVVLPNHEVFMELLGKTEMVADMTQYVESVGLRPRTNRHTKILHSNVRRVFDEYGEIRKGREKRAEAERYMSEIAGDDDGTIRLNGWVFIRADTKDKLSLKVMDDTFGIDWKWGSTLELGENSIYDTHSFEIAFADRIAFATEKWKSMCDEDRNSWVKGGFTDSPEARKGHYDKVQIAADNRYTG